MMVYVVALTFMFTAALIGAFISLMVAIGGLGFLEVLRYCHNDRIVGAEAISRLHFLVKNAPRIMAATEATYKILGLDKPVVDAQVDSPG